MQRLKILIKRFSIPEVAKKILDSDEMFGLFFCKEKLPTTWTGAADPSAKKCMSNVSPIREKTFRQKKKALLWAQDKFIAHYELRIEKISFLSLAGQTVIVNQAILLASGRNYLRLLKLFWLNDIFAESLAVTVTGSLRLIPNSLLRLAPPDSIAIKFSTRIYSYKSVRLSTKKSLTATKFLC